MRDKRGLSAIITTLLVVLLVLVAVGIVWGVVGKIIREGAESIDLGKLTLKADIISASIDNSSNNITVTVERTPGQGELMAIRFIFFDGTNSEVVTRMTNMKELESQSFNLHLLELNVNNILTISIVPVFESSSGKELLGNVVSVYDVRTGEIQEPEDPEECGNGVCEVGENCLSDVGDCTDRICYTAPTCSNGCVDTLIASGGTDVGCDSSNQECNGAGQCVCSSGWVDCADTCECNTGGGYSCVGGVCSAPTGNYYYVSPTGSGTDCSDPMPCDLNYAMGIVQEGETIILEDGNYGSFTETDSLRSDWVTLRADNNHMAIFTNLNINYDSITDSYLRFEGVYINPLRGSGSGVSIDYANNFELRNSIIEGEKYCSESGTSGIPICVTGIYLTNSRNGLFQDNKIFSVQRGMIIIGSRNVIINHNYLNITSGTGIQYAGDNEYFNITNNHIHGTDYVSYPMDPDAPEDPHASIISIRSGDVEIRGNILHGMGSSSGIMFYTPDAAGGEISYSNILFENNLMYHAENANMMRMYNLGRNVVFRNNLFSSRYREGTCDGITNDGRYRYESAFSVHSLAADYDDSLEVYNNLFIGVADFVEGMSFNEGNNIYWSYTLDGTNFLCESFSGTSKILTCSYGGCDTFDPDNPFPRHPLDLEDGTYFENTPDFFGPNRQIIDFSFAENSEGINFGDPNNQPSDSLGNLGSDGFIVMDGIARDSQHHSVGPYEYTS